MKFLNLEGLQKLINNFKVALQTKISSNEIKKIELVEQLPNVEENGVLYLVKNTTEQPIIENLYYQDTKKEYTSSSGITYIFDIDKTLTLNGMPKSDASTYSNNFVMNLSASKKYKFSVKKASDTVLINNNAFRLYLYERTTNTEITRLEVEFNDEISSEFTVTTNEEQNYAIRAYVYGGNTYDNLKFNILIEEV